MDWSADDRESLPNALPGFSWPWICASASLLYVSFQLNGCTKRAVYSLFGIGSGSGAGAGSSSFLTRSRSSPVKDRVWTVDLGVSEICEGGILVGGRHVASQYNLETLVILVMAEL